MIKLFKKLAYKFLLENFRWLDKLNWFHPFWDRVTLPAFDIQAKLFGTSFYLPSTYRYPVTARFYPEFNNPLLQLVYESHKLKKRKLVIADVGAAVGDTFQFLKQNIPEAIGKIYCIEGLPFFLKYLVVNTKHHTEAVIIQAILSDKRETISELIQIHESTASAQGESVVPAETLDSLTVINDTLDILKIDVDGFDGKVLAGAKRILKDQSPYVIFEFHPILIKNTGNDYLGPFMVLMDCGYDKLVWFDKTGRFSHFSKINDQDTIRNQISLCLEDPKLDWHFDIVALPQLSGIDIHDLAACRFAKNKLYSF